MNKREADNMKDLIEITKKQIMPDYLELMTIQDIVNQYSEQPWSALWAASMCYQAGRIAGIRQERARRNGKALPRVKIAFTDSKYKSVSIDLETGQGCNANGRQDNPEKVKGCV